MVENTLETIVFNQYQIWSLLHCSHTFFFLHHFLALTLQPQPAVFPPSMGSCSTFRVSAEEKWVLGKKLFLLAPIWTHPICLMTVSTSFLHTKVSWNIQLAGRRTAKKQSADNLRWREEGEKCEERRRGEVTGRERWATAECFMRGHTEDKSNWQQLCYHCTHFSPLGSLPLPVRPTLYHF